MLVCDVRAYVLVTPIMSILVGQAAHTLGVHKRTVIRLIVLIIFAFLVVLPYIESHPQILSKMKIGYNRKYGQLLKTINYYKPKSETKKLGDDSYKRDGFKSIGPLSRNK